MRIIDFDVYRDLLCEKSGMLLSSDQTYMLDSRLSPIAKKWGYPSLEAMTIVLQGVPDKDLVNDIVEAMTVNETAFFRDRAVFQFFDEVILPKLAKARASKRALSIWSAACSSGQEPYSIALYLHNQPQLFAGWKTKILATDICSEMLAQAREGIYSQHEAQRGLPIRMLLKHFEQDDTNWRIRKEISKMVRFERFNLVSSMSKLGPFDVIFCMDVLPYFEDNAKAKIVKNLAKRLNPDGYLVMGEYETVTGLCDAFEPQDECGGVFVKS